MRLTVQHKLLLGFFAITLGSALTSVLNFDALHSLTQRLTYMTNNHIPRLERIIESHSALTTISNSSVYLERSGATTLPKQFQAAWQRVLTQLEQVEPQHLHSVGLDGQQVQHIIGDFLADLEEIDHLLLNHQMIVSQEQRLLDKLDALEPELVQTTKAIQAYFESANIQTSPTLTLSSYAHLANPRPIQFEEMSTMSILNSTAYNLNALYQVMLRVISAKNNQQLAKLQQQLVTLKNDLDQQFVYLQAHYIGQSLRTVYQELLPFMIGEQALVHLKRQKLRFSGLIVAKLTSHHDYAQQLSKQTAILVTESERVIQDAALAAEKNSANVGMIVLASSSAVFLLSLLIVYGAIGRNIARPITQTAQAMLDIVNGKPAAALNDKRDDEIGDMARALNTLTSYVQRVKQAEQEKHQQQILLNTILDSLNALVMVRNQQGEIILANHYCHTIQDWQLLDQEITDEQYQCSHAFEEALLHDDGHNHQYLTQRVPLRNDQSQIEGLIRLSTDISQQKAFELQLAEARDLAQASTKAKSEFLAAMSHEIRTPLNGVLGTLEMLALTDMNAEQREYIETVNESSQALLSIINDILDFSKIEAGKMDIEPIPTDIRTTIETLMSLHSANLRNQELQMRLYIDPSLSARLSIDEIRLRQLLENLLGNAIKFTQQGYVAINVEVLADNLKSQKIAISVADTGIGISPASQKTLFDQFTQAESSTTRRFGGTGLGLAICQRLCQLMNIELKVESQPQQGSCFTLTMELPKHSQGYSIINEAQLPVFILSDESYVNHCIKHYLSALSIHYQMIEQSALITQLSQASAEDGVFIVDFTTLELHASRTEKQIEDWLNSLEARLVVLHPNRALWTETQTFIPSNPIRATQVFKAFKQHLERSDTPTVSRADCELENADLSNFHILVAEDNEMNQKLIINQLRHFNLNHTLVADGEQALALIQTSWQKPSAQQFDALLTDCHMPVMDGYQLTEHIRHHEPLGQRLPIIALTANALVGESKKCLSAGMDDFMSKPVKLNHLNQVLSKWLTSKRCLGSK